MAVSTSRLVPQQHTIITQALILRGAMPPPGVRRPHPALSPRYALRTHNTALQALLDGGMPLYLAGLIVCLSDCAACKWLFRVGSVLAANAFTSASCTSLAASSNSLTASSCAEMPI